MSSAPTAQQAAPSNYQKYQTKNPIVRSLIAKFLGRITTHTALLRPTQVVDLGSGEGMVAEALSKLPFSFEYKGVELNPEAVRLARSRLPHLSFEVGNIVTTPPVDNWADLAICLEVLEHLDEPQKAVANIARWTRKNAILSVPHEPYFRLGSLLRGKYVSTLGNHPEHIQQFSPKSFRALLTPHFAHVHVETAFPWLIAVVGK